MGATLPSLVIVAITASSASDLGHASVRYLAAGIDRDVSPRWSPDGTQIAFMRMAGAKQREPLIPVQPLPWSIWVADATHNDGHQVWKSGERPGDSFPELTANISFLFPANNRLVFASEQDGWNHLYAIATVGGPPVLLTPGAF